MIQKDLFSSINLLLLPPIVVQGGILTNIANITDTLNVVHGVQVEFQTRHLLRAQNSCI